jgi:methyl-accepting chemotaxis protein/predicted DNA-binding protein
MSNQKQYQIVINGIKESISDIDILLKQLDELDNRLKNVGKNGIKVDTKALKELEKIKIPEISLEGIETKSLQKEMKQLEKDVAKGAKTIDGEYTNTLNGLRAKLRDLKQELGTVDLDLDADTFQDLTDEIKDLNDQVKQMEQDYGTFSRNVGNYTDSMVDALNEFDGQMYETVDGIKEIKSSVDSLKGKQSFDVNIGNQVVQFENVSQAIGEIDDMAHRAAAQMQALRDAGKQNTDEYNKLNQEFQEFITISANLERVRKQTDELRDSIASSTRGLDLGVQGFQALGNAMQMASGIAGLFGQNQEKVEEAINRTVQIQAILQSAQELYNQAVQKGTLLNTIYSNTFGKITSGIGRMVTSLNLGTKAAKGLNTVLKANIFVAIATAILYVVTNLDKLSNILGITNKETETFTNLWNKISPIIMGVGRVITDWLINPIRTLISTMAKLIDGDFKGAFEEIGKGFKEQFNIIEDYQKGYNDEIIRQQETVTKKQKIELDKQLLNDIKYNEAKYGSDWKYTKKGIELYRQYFANKLALYNKDTDEYREALIEQLNFERELKEHLKTNSTETAKSQADIKREIIDAEIAAMKDGFKKEQALLLEQQRRELEDAANNNKLKTALQKKHQKELEDLYKEHFDNLIKNREDLSNELFKIDNKTNALNSNNALKKTEYELDVYDKKLEGKRYDSNGTKEIKDLVFNYGGLSEEEKVSEMQRTNNTILLLCEQYAQDMKFINEQMNGTLSDEHRKHYEKLLKITVKNNEHFEKLAIDYSGNYIGIINDRIVAERDIETVNYREQLDELETWYDEKLKAEKENEQKALELFGVNGDIRMMIMEQSNDVLIQIEKEYEDKKLALLVDYMNKNQLIEVNANKERSNIVSKYHDIIYNEYRKHYEQLNQLREEYSNIDEVNLPTELSSMGSFSVQILEMNKFKDEYKKTIENIAKQKAELQKQFEDGVISADAYSKQMNELQVFEKETKDVLNNISMDWKDWATGIAEVASAMVLMWSQTFSMLADLQYNNEMKRIEQLEKDYDEELELLQEKFDEQEELYKKHNDNVNSIEGELETARGDRRLFLLDQINSEMQKREQAWATQQKIAKQQDQLDKKKKQLEDQKEQAEKKRNKANQKVQIAQGLANTALAITNALSVSPWFLGVALAAVAAAMGAAQVAIIRKQKFADGGQLIGKSHNQGGIPVGNTGIEVEGNEWIINKNTSMKNTDLLYYINSKKKKLDLNDFIDFYSSGSRQSIKTPKTIFADGGTLPSQMNAPQMNVRNINASQYSDNRPIYVSVTEIENVQERVRNVRVLSGIED